MDAKIQAKWLIYKKSKHRLQTQLLALCKNIFLWTTKARIKISLDLWIFLSIFYTFKMHALLLYNLSFQNLLFVVWFLSNCCTSSFYIKYANLLKDGLCKLKEQIKSLIRSKKQFQKLWIKFKSRKLLNPYPRRLTYLWIYLLFQH